MDWNNFHTCSPPQIFVEQSMVLETTGLLPLVPIERAEWDDGSRSVEAFHDGVKGVGNQGVKGEVKIRELIMVEGKRNEIWV
ncbi:hypothetical protein V6N13_056900 [Hibiscus sabdariffa]|uniref:Uncharacterized protein n=1 Tax=Hibiscus sabdariffa TaxID=183260 RepID=A0ABR2PIW7_9ROSI